MSENRYFRCDGCGKGSEVDIGRHLPEGWIELYLVRRASGAMPLQRGDEASLHACSETCVGLNLDSPASSPGILATLYRKTSELAKVRAR